MRRECRELFPLHTGFSHPDMHHGMCVTHVPWCMPGSLTSDFLWSQSRGKRSRHSRRMRKPQFYVSGTRSMGYVLHEDEINWKLAICAGNSPVTGEFPSQRPVTRSFGVFFGLRLNKRLSKQSRGWWFETPSRSLWCHSNDLLILIALGHNGLIILYEGLQIDEHKEPYDNIGCLNRPWKYFLRSTIYLS